AAALGTLAPELAGLTAWFNAEPLRLADLRGRVVLVDFWTYSCVNCLRTFPHLAAWHDRYAARGLTILGIHTPEFAFEREPANVGEAVRRLGVTWPVALDADSATWRAFGNRFWPQKWLIDARGVIRYQRIGEGGYGETEYLIRDLLEEIGRKVDDVTVPLDPDEGGLDRILQTPELYAGYTFALSIGNP